MDTVTVSILLSRLPKVFKAALVFREDGITGVKHLLTTHYFHHITIHEQDLPMAEKAAEMLNWQACPERTIRVELKNPDCRRDMSFIGRHLERVEPLDLHEDLKLHAKPLPSRRAQAALLRGQALALMDSMMQFGDYLPDKLREDWGISLSADVDYENDFLPGQMTFTFKADDHPFHSVMIDPLTGEVFINGDNPVSYEGTASVHRILRQQADEYLEMVTAA